MRGRNRQHLVRIVVAGAIAVSLSSIAMGAFEAGPKAAAGEGLIVWAEAGMSGVWEAVYDL